MQTIRYRDAQSGDTQLGLLLGNKVYNITAQNPYWADPVSLWYALQAMGIHPRDAESKLSTGNVVDYQDLQVQGLLLPPVHSNEVWAAGVTYERSRNARNSETRISDSVYDRVYESERPELFFKATSDRVVSPGKSLGLRSDSAWMVPEPEFAVVISSTGDIIGWTLGNDLSSRDIEGENPLYLPQAKVFSRSCSFGPTLLWQTNDIGNPRDWDIHIRITRSQRDVYSDSVSFGQFRRSVSTLIEYLLRDNTVPNGTVLMTGTGLVPPDDFTLQAGDVCTISVNAIGELTNPIA